MGDFYESSGVSIARGDAASADAFAQLQRTFNVYSQLIKGLVLLKADFSGMEDPFLAFAPDGVGTKLKYAFASGQHKTVGIDLVAMCVNDLARNNITPLGFALYRATGKIDSEVMHDVVEGVVEGCLQAGCVYMTGETAEMPGFYHDGEYDLAGFAVGVFDRDKLITGERIKAGDTVFGIASSGLHSNGFSAVRKLFPPEEVVGQPKLLAQLLQPTRIYVRDVLEVSNVLGIHGWAHITGGGIIGKLGKIIPNGLVATLTIDSWPTPEIFERVRKSGSISWKEMRSTFNCGLGMIGVADNATAETAIRRLNRNGEQAYIVGEIDEVGPDEEDKVVFI